MKMKMKMKMKIMKMVGYVFKIFLGLMSIVDCSFKGLMVLEFAVLYVLCRFMFYVDLCFMFYVERLLGEREKREKR